MSSFVIETRGVPAVERMLRRLSFLELDEALDAMGTIVENQVRRRISKQEGAPDGSSWEPLSDSYEKWKQQRSSGGILELYGDLRDSLTHNVLSDGVEIGSNLVYAGVQQETRPYLGLSDDNVSELEDEIDRWIRRKVGR